MKRTTLRGLVVIEFLLAANAGLLFAQSSFFTEGVTCRTNRTVLQRGSERTLLEAKMKMPGGIEVFTNGTFRVNEGKTRHLQEGQLLRPDGNLDRKSTRLNSSHLGISYAVFCLKKKNSRPTLRHYPTRNPAARSWRLRTAPS